MIENITINNFKCFEHQSIDLKMLNVLTGLNGTGKSTVLQSLLALMQTYKKTYFFGGGLELNGKYVELGIGADVLYENADDSEGVMFEITEDKYKYRFHFEYQPDARVLDFFPHEEVKNPPKFMSYDELYYLSANRIVPRGSYSITDADEVLKRRFGNNGEFAIQYLAMSRIEKGINGIRRFAPNLWENVEEEMNKISPGIMPVIRLDNNMGFSELRYEFRNGKLKTNAYKALNVGFGATNILPVIVFLLSARQGDVLLLENPEVHIHPKGQRELGELIAKTAARGVQIIVETHSDHVMNGIRVAVKRDKINCEEVSFLYFYQDEDFSHKSLKPKIDENGHFDFWPSGFFDEWDEAMLDLL